METPKGPGGEPGKGPLETFLGGMETEDYSGKAACAVCPLKPSLVEWKLPPQVLLPVIDQALKPSLVEWKLVIDKLEAIIDPEP